MTAPRIRELWRYPVKGLLGEAVSTLRLTDRGAEGDRIYCVRGEDGKFGSAKTTRRFRRMPGLLSLSSRMCDGEAVVRFPDGEDGGAASPKTWARVSEVVGERVSLTLEGAVSHFDDAPLHLLTSSSMAWLQSLSPDSAVDGRRFRPNILLDSVGEAPLEPAWLGATFGAGSAMVLIEKLTQRCVTVTLAQEELEFAPGLLSELQRASGACLGAYASVLQPGTCSVGDCFEPATDLSRVGA